VDNPKVNCDAKADGQLHQGPGRYWVVFRANVDGQGLKHKNADPKM